MNGSILKFIAVLSMTIDHIGNFLLGEDHPYYVYCRVLGRVAFPIFAFLCVEGFIHTSSRCRYLSLLFFFACVSELPWQLLGVPGHNVLFTLFMGVLSLVFLESAHQYNEPSSYVFLVVLAFISYYFQADYGLPGMLVIDVFYLSRHYRERTLLFVCILLTSSSSVHYVTLAGTLLCCLLLYLYNGERGFIRRGMWKYAIYVYYPLHLFIIWLFTFSYN